MPVFTCQEDYDRLISRVHRAKSRAVRDKAEKDLEALRRSPEHADGLDVFFDKHMTDRHGKYPVLRQCGAYAESDGSCTGMVWEDRRQAPCLLRVFRRPKASRAFQDFKADNSDHLKLLFCIYMLNEDIQVEDTALLRDTASCLHIFFSPCIDFQ